MERQLTREDYKKLIDVFNKAYMQLVEWLIEKYPLVWKEYEKEKMNGKRLMFLRKKH